MPSSPRCHGARRMASARAVLRGLLIVLFAALCLAATAALVLRNWPFFRRSWERVMPMGHISFGASHVRIQPDTGHLVPTAETCSRRWRSDFLSFEQCHGDVLRSAASTLDRARPSVPQVAAASPGNDASWASSNRFLDTTKGGVAHASTQGGKAKHRGLRGASSVGPSLFSPASGQRGLESAAGSSREATPLGQEGRNGMAAAADSGVEWVTHATQCSMAVNRLAQAVGDVGIKLSVLGLGTFWKNRWGYRMRLLHDYLVGLPEERLVIVTDSEDVIPVPSTTPQEVQLRYAELVKLYRGPRLFFAAETICYPKPHLWVNYTAAENIPGGKGWSPFRYVNAGAMVGPAGLMRRMLELAYQRDCLDDQYIYTLAHLDPLLWWKDPASGEYVVASSRETRAQDLPADAKPLIGVDHWSGLLLAMYGVAHSAYSIDERRQVVRVSPTGAWSGSPLILHQNGNKRETGPLLEVFSREFGYNYDRSVVEAEERKGNLKELKLL